MGDGRATRNAHKIVVINPEERDHYEDLGIDGMMILKFLSGKQFWVHLPQDRGRWQVFGKMVTNSSVPLRRKIS